MATIIELREEIRRFAEELSAKYGPVGAKPGVALFTVMEDLACELGDTLAQEVLRYQAAQHDDSAEVCCPQCGQPGLRKRAQPRVVTSCRGPVEVSELECYCKRCRKSFFPSRSGTGTGSGL
jgi:hypothetical protein